MSVQQQTETIPFTNGGLVTKVDMALLQQGQYYAFTNMISMQEGSIASRLGERNLTASLDRDLFSSGGEVLHSLSKLRLSETDTSNPRYIGWDTAIFRVLPNSLGNYVVTTEVAVGNLGDRYLSAARWTTAQFNAGEASKASIFFAHESAMMRDDGVADKLLQWGVPPAIRPAYARVSKQTLIPVSINTGSGAVPNYQTLINITASVAVSVVGSDGVYRNTYTLTGGQSPVVDTVLTNGSTNVVVLSVDALNLTFDCYATGTLSGAYSSGYSAATTSTSGIGEIAVGPFTAINAAFDGSASDGYTTKDFFGVGVWFDKPVSVSDVRIRIYVGGSTDDFYEKPIAPSTISNLAQAAGTFGIEETPQDAALERSDYLSKGIVGEYEYEIDSTSLGLRFGELNAQASDPTSGSFTNFLFSKDEFLTIGRAGSPGLDWSVVTKIALLWKTTSAGSPAVTGRIGPSYFFGGQKPNGGLPGAVPYSYVYCFRNAISGSIGNPSIPMIEANAVLPRRSTVIVSGRGISYTISDGPQRDGLDLYGSLYVYRTGGVFSDGLYRLCKILTNPGDADWAFEDNASDEELLAQPIAEFDNDPPVTSNLKTPVNATISALTTGGGQPNILNVFTVTVATGDLSEIRECTNARIGSGESLEICRVVSATSTTITVYPQKAHAVGDAVIIETNAFEPCDLVCQAFDSLFLGGDKNNPHILYKSKNGRPESFPTINEITRVANKIAVGNPSNGIRAITEHGGEVVSLNANSLFVVRAWQGALQTPLEVPASKGLVGKRAWAKGGGRIFYLGTDGVYAWAGGVSELISEAVDWIFKDETVNGIPPLRKSDLDNEVAFGYGRNKLFISYVNTDGIYAQLTFDTRSSRWSLGVTIDSGGNVLPYRAYYTEEDTGRILASRLYGVDGFYYVEQLEQSGTIGNTDGFDTGVSTSGTTGDTIYFRAQTPSYTGGQPSIEKWLNDTVLELTNPDSDVAVRPVYNNKAQGGQEAFVIPATKGTFTIVGATVTRTSGTAFTSDMVGSEIAISDVMRTITGFTSSNVITISSTVSGTPNTFYIFYRRRVALPANASGAPSNTAGLKFYAVSYDITGTGKLQTSLHSLTFNYNAMEQVQRGKSSDWSDEGYPYDKRLDVLNFEYDTSGQAMTFLVDTLSGVNGETVTLGVATFTIGADGNNAAYTRGKKAIPIRRTSDGTAIICKMVRIRPNVPTDNVLIWSDWQFTYEKYPPDITYFTEPSNYGSPFEKYFNQLLMEVDTGGVEAQVAIFVDNVAVPFQTVFLTTTNNDRQRNYTLVQGIAGKLARLVITPGASGKFQLFNHTFVTTPADKGPVMHSFDWDNLGHPFDKRLYQMTFEYEVTQAVTMVIEGLMGTGANQTTSVISQFVLTP